MNLRKELLEKRIEEGRGPKPKNQNKMHYKKEPSPEEEALKAKTRKMIEEFLVPTFRQIDSDYPNATKLAITFVDTCNGFYYFTSADKKNSSINDIPFKYCGDMFDQAIKIAFPEYGIRAHTKSGDYTCSYEFYLNLGRI